jgi:hypothetical protein
MRGTRGGLKKPHFHLFHLLSSLHRGATRPAAHSSVVNVHSTVCQCKNGNIQFFE